MTIDELEKLIKRAEDVLGHKLQMSKLYSDKWSIHIHAGPVKNDLCDATFDECVAQLRKWGTPPKPKTLTITLPTDYCETVLSNITKAGSYECYRAGSLHNALVEALKPYQEQP